MSESWGNDAGVPGFRLGARLRPAPASVPLLRASLSPVVARPRKRRWDQLLDLTGDDGKIDDLGNCEISNCVPVAVLRVIQSWIRDGRKPTRDMAMSLLADWDGSPESGTYTDTAFSRWCSKGVVWGDRLIVPRWTLIERDGLYPNLAHIKQAIDALGAALGIFDTPRAWLGADRFDVPMPGTRDAESVGHHAIALLGYDDDELCFYGPSWGPVREITYAAVSSRIRQASAFASDAWVHAVGDGTSRTPSGLTADEIRAIGAEVAGV